MGSRILMQVGGRVRPLSFTGGPPALSSVGTSWAGPLLELHHMRSAEGVGETGPCDGECGLLVVVEGQIDITLREGPRDVVYHTVPGSMILLSGTHRPYLVRLQGEASAVALQLSKAWCERLLLDELPREARKGERVTTDPTVLALPRALHEEVARGASSGRLFADSLSVALMSYVLAHVPPSPVRARGRLNDEQQRRLRNHIRDHLGESLPLSRLAGLIGCSPRHFTSLFKEAFGMPPHRYVLEARLAEGARLLGEGRADVSEVGRQLGFCSPSHFATAFRRTYGTTPSSYVARQRSGA
jgi:AraC family transcriptional regulator